MKTAARATQQELQEWADYFGTEVNAPYFHLRVKTVKGRAAFSIIKELDLPKELATEGCMREHPSCEPLYRFEILEKRSDNLKLVEAIIELGLPKSLLYDHTKKAAEQFNTFSRHIQDGLDVAALKGMNLPHDFLARVLLEPGYYERFNPLPERAKDVEAVKVIQRLNLSADYLNSEILADRFKTLSARAKSAEAVNVIEELKINSNLLCEPTYYQHFQTFLDRIAHKDAIAVIKEHGLQRELLYAADKQDEFATLLERIQYKSALLELGRLDFPSKNGVFYKPKMQAEFEAFCGNIEHESYPQVKSLMKLTSIPTTHLLTPNWVEDYVTTLRSVTSGLDGGGTSRAAPALRSIK